MSTNPLCLFCLVDGESTSSAFPVSAATTTTIEELKKLIKAEKTIAFSDIDADQLTLWRTTISDEDDERPILLDNITDTDDKKKLSNPRTRLSKLFPDSPDDDTYIIVQRPFLPQTVHQRLSSFSSVRTFTTESDLQGIFRHDVGSVRSLPPFADTYGSFSLPFGTPDLVCSRENDQSVLFPIEMKRLIELHLDDNTSYPAAYLAQESPTQCPIGPLRQIFGYMRLNGFRYGVLSTYRQTWFIKRVSGRGNDILVSPTIRFDRTEPTLLQCYLWLIRTADNDTEWQPDIPDEASVEAMLSKEQPDKDANRDSDFDPGRRGKLKQEMKNFFTRSSLQELELTKYGEGARTFRATWMNDDVVVKKADIWNQHLVTDELEHEATVYEALRTLQGRYVPKLRLAGIADGMEMILVTELTGTDLHDGRLNASDRNKIREALSAIHDLGVLHGDIRPENITRRRDDRNSAFFFIDFGRSELTRCEMALKGEKEELEALLDMIPWPEGENS
ncbi:hypothetical protein BGW42_003269 [Actinomortierella wolfii]|nr:hypothetical protein BGW42_003269 [Actinomortierella wolfii]